MLKPEFVEFDREQAFVIYATFAGDVERTAHALGLRAIDVLRVVDEENWTEKLRPIIELKKSTRPGDFERAINRALNFAQAHRLRLFLERVVHRITGMKAEELEEYLLRGPDTKDGAQTKKLTTRALADLAAALEKCHAMTYLSLNDTVQDRSRRKEQASGDDGGAGDIHAKIAEAMAKAGASVTPRAKLLDAQLVVAESQVKPAALALDAPDNRAPYDKDEH